MKPSNFPQATGLLTRPPSMTAEECSSLHVHRTAEAFISCWRPTWRERLALFFGAPVTHGRSPVPDSHPFDRVPLYPGGGYKSGCGVCGKPETEHVKEVPPAGEMLALLRELADCLCGLRIVTHAERNELLGRLAKYRSPVVEEAEK